MANPIPEEIAGQKYVSLKTFRKNGVGVATPVWFGEEGDKLYVMTRSDMGKTKRIRNNPQVRVAACTIRGTVTGRSSRRRRGFCRSRIMRGRGRRSTGSIGRRGFRFCGGGRIRTLS
jgi:PPOX class probable F420-dependent enzyme